MIGTRVLQELLPLATEDPELLLKSTNVRANLSDSREDFDDSEAGLTYQTLAKPKLHEKRRKTLRKPPED